MKKAAVSFLGVAFTVMATHASAALIEDFGVIPASGATETVLFSNTHDFLEAGSFFIDAWTFTLEQDAIVALLVEDIPLPPLLDIRGLQPRLVGESGAVMFEGFGDITQSGDLALLAGDYTIEILGDVTSGSVYSGGAYAGALVVASVPIPAAGLLFFSGIAALGAAFVKRVDA